MKLVRLPAGRLVIATLVGTLCGAVAGLWSIAGRSPAGASTPVTRAITQSSILPASQSLKEPQKRDGDAAPASSLAVRSASGGERSDVLRRARALAQRGDVRALVALREDIVRRGEGDGETGSAVSEQDLDEFDRYLEEARFLRLKLDAEEFKRAEPARSRPR